LLPSLFGSLHLIDILVVLAYLAADRDRPSGRRRHEQRGRLFLRQRRLNLARGRIAGYVGSG
jgi:hypothetical protein